LYGGKHVLGAVVELANEEPARLLGRFPFEKVRQLPGEEIEKCKTRSLGRYGSRQRVESMPRLHCCRAG